MFCIKLQNRMILHRYIDVLILRKIDYVCIVRNPLVSYFLTVLHASRINLGKRGCYLKQIKCYVSLFSSSISLRYFCIEIEDISKA